jgi:hypothetical protein
MRDITRSSGKWNWGIKRYLDNNFPGFSGQVNFQMHRMVMLVLK